MSCSFGVVVMITVLPVVTFIVVVVVVVVEKHVNVGDVIPVAVFEECCLIQVCG